MSRLPAFLKSWPEWKRKIGLQILRDYKKSTAAPTGEKPEGENQ